MKSLLDSAYQLALAGELLEKARLELQQLVDFGVPYESEQMQKALLKYKLLQEQWNTLEERHLALKNSQSQPRS